MTGKTLGSGDKGISGRGSDNALWRVPEWFPHLDASLLKALKTYHSELLKFNSRINLISKNTERDCDETHFADCILAVEILMKLGVGPEIHDIGSGNGLPGLMMAIFFPKTKFF